MLNYGYGYGYSIGITAILSISALIMAIAGTILSFIFITSEKKRDKLPKFFRIVADIFNFRGLIIEKILKALYIFFTLYSITYGFFTIFTGVNVLSSLLTMLLGPIVIRISFELIMMFVLLVKNVISINNKLKYQTEEPAKDDFSFDYSTLGNDEAPKTDNSVFCPTCGAKIDNGVLFCANCGTSINK